VKDLENYNKNKRILVVGGSGQVGTEIKNQNNEANLEFFFPSSKEFDLTDSLKVKKLLSGNNFDYIINLGAYTNVDSAEKKRDICKRVNHLGVENLSREAYLNNINLIHTSTDYVFGENSSAPFHPNDKKGPINYYGLTKSDGEDAVLKNHKTSIIFRFSSVFSQYGNNFVKNIIKLLLTKDQVRVVADQKISLTYAADFSKNIKQVIDLQKNKEIDERIYHFCSPGSSTWYLVAKIIFSELEKNLKKPLNVNLVPISLNDWKSEAKRPIDTRLYADFDFYLKNDIKFSSWEDSVKLVVERVTPKILEEI